MDNSKPIRARRRIVIVGALAGVLAVGIVLLIASLPGIMRWVVVRAARARGVDIVVQSVEPSWGSVCLRDVDVSLQGVDGVRAQVKTATVALRGLSPERVDAAGVSVSIEGAAGDVLVDMATFAKVQGDALRFPIEANAVSVQWTERSNEPPWLQLADGAIIHSPGGERVHAEVALVLDVKVGPVGASWSADQVTASLGFGNGDLDKALVRVDVPRGGSEAIVTLRPVRVGDLQRPLGVTMPVSRDAMVSGTGSIGLEPGAGRAVQGTIRLSLRGWVPPHPKELDGILFGDETKFETSFSMDGARKRVTLSKSVVSAGAFVLQGGGSVDRLGDHASVAMDMSGAIPCQALAKSAVGAHVPGPLGQLVGDVVKGALKGVVSVTASLRADTRNLGNAQVKHSVAIGCTPNL